MRSPQVIVMQRPERTSDRVGDLNGAQPTLGTWQGRPVAAALLKGALFLGPLLASLVVTRLLFLALDVPSTRGAQVTLWIVLLSVGFVTAALVERFTRRYLPVAMLMRLTLVFPDQAPSRYKLMRAAASPARLKEIASSGSAASDAATQVLGLVAELARHDKHTRGHSERVRVFADLIAEELGVAGLDRDKLRWSALLHDIGKLDVPAAILNKPGRPDQDEWAVLQGHPAAGEGRSGALYAWLGEWAGGITEHHERFDGAGYPLRLAGEQISLAGRIVAVADAYETMTAARAYKKPMATAAARQELADCAGQQFDPLVVRALLEVSLPKLMWRVGPLSFLTHLPFLNSIHLATQSALATVGSAVVPAAVAGLTATAVVTGALAGPGHGATGDTSLSTASAAQSETVPLIGPDRPASAPDAGSGGTGAAPGDPTATTEIADPAAPVAGQLPATPPTTSDDPGTGPSVVAPPPAPSTVVKPPATVTGPTTAPAAPASTAAPATSAPTAPRTTPPASSGSGSSGSGSSGSGSSGSGSGGSGSGGRVHVCIAGICINL